MSGYCYGEPEPVEACPYCNAECHADFVDIGVGLTQCGPYHCEVCGASETGPYDKRELTEAEKKTGWYAPGAPPSETANVIGGKVVSHQEMLVAYKAEFTGNPAWEEPGAVEEWRDQIRKSVS